ncbi:MAG TPA: metallophosphoesterase, partial [Ignavibacteriaceae bacterium]|nr:metallophosphoesterase [Ignavibacteriaceae bacterium]
MGMVIRIVLFIALLFLIEFYFTKKAFRAFLTVYPGISKSKSKFVKIIALVFFNLYPLFVVVVWAYQAIARPVNFLFPAGRVIDYLLVYPFWFFIVLVVQCILFFLLIDIIKLIFLPLYRKYKEKIFPYEARFLFIIILFFTAYIPLRMYYDYNFVNIRETVYHKEDLPDVLNNMRIVLISDIHADRYTDKKRALRFVRKINSTNPDLVLIGGDLISSGPAYIDSVAQYLGNISSKYGVYSCVGDHDNWAYRSDNARSKKEITEALAKFNVFMFDDKQQSLLI